MTPSAKKLEDFEIEIPLKHRAAFREIRADIEKLAAALRDTAKQHLAVEYEDENGELPDSGQVLYAYEYIVKKARATIRDLGLDKETK